MDTTLTRRRMTATLGATGVAGIGALLGACALSPSGTDGSRQEALAQARGEFIFISHSIPETYQKWTDQFFQSRYPNVTVKYEITPGLEEYFTKFVALIAADQTADFMLNHESRAQALAYKGAILPLDSYKAKAPFLVPESELFTRPVPTLSWKGNVYAWPNLMASHAIYYNKTLFERARVPLPADSWTWDDLADAAQRLTSNVPGQPQVWGWAEWGDLAWPPGWYPLLRAHGGDHFDKDQTKSVINQKGGIAALEYMQSLWCKRQAALDPPSLKQAGGTNELFKQGFGAMKLGAAGEYRKVFNDTKERFEWGLVIQPSGPAGRFIRSGGSSWSIPKTSRLRGLAWEYARHQVSDLEIVRGIAREQGSAVAHIPTFEKELAPAGEMAPWADAWRKAYVEGVVKYGTSPNYSRVGSEYTPILGEELNAMAKCTKSPRETADSIATRTNKLLSEAR